MQATFLAVPVAVVTAGGKAGMAALVAPVIATRLVEVAVAVVRAAPVAQAALVVPASVLGN